MVLSLRRCAARTTWPAPAAPAPPAGDADMSAHHPPRYGSQPVRTAHMPTDNLEVVYEYRDESHPSQTTLLLLSTHSLKIRTIFPIACKLIERWNVSDSVADQLRLAPYDRTIMRANTVDFIYRVITANYWNVYTVTITVHNFVRSPLHSVIHRHYSLERDKIIHNHSQRNPHRTPSPFRRYTGHGSHAVPTLATIKTFAISHSVASIPLAQHFSLSQT